MSKPDMRIVIGLFNSRGRYHKQASRVGYDVHVQAAMSGVNVVPRPMSDGNVEYEIWATDGRYRGANKRLVGRLRGWELVLMDHATQEPVS